MSIMALNTTPFCKTLSSEQKRLAFTSKASCIREVRNNVALVQDALSNARRFLRRFFAAKSKSVLQLFDAKSTASAILQDALALFSSINSHIRAHVHTRAHVRGMVEKSANASCMVDRLSMGAVVGGAA